MRVTSGLFKSRLIKYPTHIRPTQDKVRKALFDILREKISGSYFLELFAGSGAIGIEALSNETKEVVFVEQDKRCCKIIENNLIEIGLISKDKHKISQNISILNMDALKAIDIFYKKNKKFDIVFIDPPYSPDYSYSKKNYIGIPKKYRSKIFIRERDLAKKALQKLSTYDILAPRGIIIVEHSKKEHLEENISGLTSFKQKRYGNTIISFYEKSNQSFDYAQD